MGADSRGRSKQERSGVAPNKDSHVTEYKPKQTSQTDNSFQEKHISWYHKKKKKTPKKAADIQHRNDDAEEEK